MFANDYAGMVPPEVLKLIARRAKYYRIPPDELDDLQQHLVPLMSEFRYDPAVANGASETTAMTAMIDNQIKEYRRTNRRYRQRIERFQNKNVDPSVQPEPSDLRLDLQSALRQLLPRDRKICELLSHGHAVKDIAKQLKCMRSTVVQAIPRIRKVFKDAGLQAWLDPDWKREKKDQKGEEKR